MSRKKAEGLDRLSHTFSKDLEFCEYLGATHAWRVGRLFVYVRWAQNYLPHIQEELHTMVARHFEPAHAEEAGFWTLSLVGGIFKDLSLVSYLAVRGLVSEAGFAVRRSLEHAGVLAHLWQDPTKAAFLSSPEDEDFRRAFVWEADKDRRAELKVRGIRKRFAPCTLAKAMSQLYSILSAYTVHGGSPNQLVTSEIMPTRLSCMLVNRPDPFVKDLTRDLEILGNGCEMLCVEVVFVHATFGKRYGVRPSKGGEGGFYLTKLLDRAPDGEMSHLIEATLGDLGWVDDRDSYGHA